MTDLKIVTGVRGGPNQNALIKYERPVTLAYVGKSSFKFTNAMRQKPKAHSIFGGKPIIGTCEDAVSEQKQVKEILTAIVAPVEWEEDGRRYRQEVSHSPATRDDLMDLQDKLDKQLKERQARHDGICPIRRELYTQAFDELIRQGTVNSPERGLLLLRVRDELRMTLRAYVALHESSSAFGKKKVAISDTAKDVLAKKMGVTSHERRELEEKAFELRTELELAERAYLEQKEADDKKQHDSIQFYKRAHQLLKQQLEGLISAVMPEPDDFKTHNIPLSQPVPSK